jgi:hypothetical protein
MTYNIMMDGLTSVREQSGPRANGVKFALGCHMRGDNLRRVAL